jgi:hypothetical protein
MGTLKGLSAGGRSSSLRLDAAVSVALRHKYALQSGKSEGKYGNRTCKRRELTWNI